MFIIERADKDIVLNYLNVGFSIEPDIICKSSYLAAIRHARELTGRNITNGILEQDGREDVKKRNLERKNQLETSRLKLLHINLVVPRLFYKRS